MLSISTDFKSRSNVWQIMDSAGIGAPVSAAMHPSICSHHRSAPSHLIRHGWLPTRMIMKKEQVQFPRFSRKNTDMLFHSCCGVSWGSPLSEFRFGGRRTPEGNAIRRRRRAVVTAVSGKNLVTVISAIAVPILLVLVTVIVSMVVSEKLDREFEQEIARKRALMKRLGIQEDSLDGVKEEKESVLSRPRNRPKREE